MDPVWDGITQHGVLSEGHAAARHAVADAAKRYDWSATLNLLRRDPGLVNVTRPGGASLYAPLHQAAHGGAPAEVCEELVRLGSWRTLRNARGERPVDVAERQGHAGLREILRPVLLRCVPAGILARVEAHFHEVILGRAAKEVQAAGLRLPELGPLLELPEEPRVWFAIPGMYGGFAYRLRTDGVDPMLVAESWCRVVGGSGQRHEITSAGASLVEEGFV